MADHIQLVILVVFALLILILAQSRELMRQIARTAEEWHRMRAALKGRSHATKPHEGRGASHDASDDLGGEEAQESESDRR